MLMVVTLTVLYMLMGVSLTENSTCVDGCYTDIAVLMEVSLTEDSTLLMVVTLTVLYMLM